MPDTPPPTLTFLLDDQRRRWRAGEGVGVEVYLQRYAALAADAGAVLDLIANEIAVRGQLGQAPTEGEYAGRFPSLSDRVAQLFAIRAAQATSTVTETKAAAPPPRRSRRKPPAQPPRVPGYEIIEYLDGGGQGDVWKACHLLLGREVALKVLHDKAELDETQLVRFIRESRLAARLDHPSIVRIFDCAEVEGRFYFSMEYAPNGSLKDRLVNLGRPPAEVAATLATTLARAVHHLHGLGIVHRDLKPSNVLFGADGAAKVADFGLAKCLHEDTLDLTPTHSVLGTASYMAPEQAAGRNREVGPATDVYALGAILYECLTGRPPFVGESWLDTIHLVQFRPVSPPSMECEGLPVPLERICLKCLEKAADARYPSAAALADDLQRFLEGQPVQALADDDSGDDESAEAATAPDPHQGQFPRVPGYVILGILGMGGMGTVYKARQLSLRRLVALKTVPGNNVTAARWRRLRREARLVATLNHTNIAQIYDMGEAGGLVYIAMEYVLGGDLSAALRKVGPPTPRQAAELLEALARAAALIHRRGLVHRDLKPANVLMAPPDPSLVPGAAATAEHRYGTPKITDFGLARRVGKGVGEPGDGLDGEPAESQNLTMVGEIVGTPRYMSPEQAAARDGDLTHAADVWSLGVILYELLTGVSPFGGNTLLETLTGVLKNDPEPPRKFRPDLPKKLEAICLRCLEKDPSKRYATGAELAQELHDFLSRSPADDATTAIGRDGTNGPGLWQRLRFWKKT